MRKLWCLVFLTILLISVLPSASSCPNVFAITYPDEVPSIDIPTADYIMENFFKEDHFIHVNNASTILSSDQFLGIMVLLSIYNTTKNVDYLNRAEDVWNYSEENFYDDLDLYSYNISDDTKYVLDNSYALLANLELYGVTDDSKYLHRVENVSKMIISMQMENSLFPTLSQNSDVDIKTQAMASFALLKYGNDSYKQIALSVLNATIKKYLDDGYNQSG
ncbi:MAG: glycoside hydrolase family 76 protein, partial [Thermoplasmatales archaeon]|nr:glycoside hydrolase family 76 protein [Thermoplasmatales archaeon]